MYLLFTALIDGLKKHGVVFLVLLAGLVYFHTQLEKMETRLDVCNSHIIQLYESQNVQLTEVLEKNTAVLEKLAGNQ